MKPRPLQMCYQKQHSANNSNNNSQQPGHRGGGGGETSQGPQTFKGPHACGFYFHNFYIYGLHLHAVSLPFAFPALSGLNE